MKHKIYMITCDKTNHILKLTIPLFDKYWNIEKNIKILGFNKPEMELPSDYEFISMRPAQLSIDDWGRDIASVLENIEDEYIIFMLDDFTPIDYINEDVYNKLSSLMEEDKRIVRCSLGRDMFIFSPTIVVEQYDNYSLIEQLQPSAYRITCQPSIWKTKYLVSFLKRSTNPWNFEVNNNPVDGLRMIGTKDKYAYRWSKETALSGLNPNKVNILGMKMSDVKWAVNNNILKEEDLIFGQHARVGYFKDHGYNFRVEDMKPYSTPQHYSWYYSQYHDIYK